MQALWKHRRWSRLPLATRLRGVLMAVVGTVQVATRQFLHITVIHAMIVVAIGAAVRRQKLHRLGSGHAAPSAVQ